MPTSIVPTVMQNTHTCETACKIEEKTFLKSPRKNKNKKTLIWDVPPALILNNLIPNTIENYSSEGEGKKLNSLFSPTVVVIFDRFIPL